jgi:SAM-dependent methyltransferase
MVFPGVALRDKGILEFVAGKVGLEIGGPSSVFAKHGALPIYMAAARVDNCNFASATVWEGQIAAGRNFRFSARRPPGEQFIAEATDLSFAPAATYDFVLSSHTLEHCANPLKALSEQLRVLKPGGLLVLVLPHMEATFDHRRPLTPLKHLIEDFESGVGEDDLTHLDEIVSLHDLARDPGASDAETFKALGLENGENRRLHHHVFDAESARQMAEFSGVQILGVSRPSAIDIVVLGRRPFA